MRRADGSAHERWMGQVQAWRSSGKPLSTWAREQGVSHYALRYWKRRAEGKPRAGATKPLVAKGEASAFIAVKASAPTPGGAIELIVGTIRVIVPAGFEAGTLAQVLALLERGC
jgi:hypothetical protein